MLITQYIAVVHTNFINDKFDIFVCIKPDLVLLRIVFPL